MFKYVMAATTFRAFSATPTMRHFYRTLGNTVGASVRMNKSLPFHRYDRLNRIMRLHREHGVPKDGDRILEIGTGWVHWEGLLSRLLFDVNGVLFDVWDNRQLNSLKRLASQLEQRLDTLEVDQPHKERARGLIAQIQQVESFDELYKLLGFEYIVNPGGTLTDLPHNSFDFVVSTNVMEHVHADIAQELIHGIATVLKPGGYSFQSIDLKDHLHYYDRGGTSPKQYLKYSDRDWTRWFENDVQYFNRVQRPQWLEMFENAGLTLVSENSWDVELNGLPIASQYRHLDNANLRCGSLALLHRKV